MSIRSAQPITVEFVTSSPATQAAVNADSLPTGTLVVGGVDNAAPVTVTNVDTGRYRAAVTLPTLAVGDVAEIVIAATVAAVAGKAVVWRDSKDILLDPGGATSLAGLPAMPTDWFTATGVSAAAVAKIQAGLSTYAGGDTAGTTTLLARLTATRSNLLDNLTRLDVAVSSVAGGVTVDTASIADRLLGRSIAGGTDGGRTVSQALEFLRNRWAIAAGVLTVYGPDDSTLSWTGVVTTSAGNPIVGVDPA